MKELSKLSETQWVLSGTLDRHNLPLLWRELNLFPKQGELTISLNELERIDSAGLAGLVRIQLNAQQSGVNLNYINATEQLLHLAQMSNVANILPLS